MKFLTEASIFLANYSNEICFMLNFSFSSNLKVIKWGLFKQAPDPPARRPEFCVNSSVAQKIIQNLCKNKC